MGGGLTEATRKLRAQGMVSGGTVCRGMGATLEVVISKELNNADKS